MSENEGGEVSIVKPLTGTDSATVDEKGRVPLGAKNASRLGRDFVAAMGMNGCLCLYPQKRWNDLWQALRNFAGETDEFQQYTRVIGPKMEDDLNCDAQGRVVIPGRLRDLANLKGKILVLGCIDRIELWTEKEYEEFQKYPEAYGGASRAVFKRMYEALKAA